MRRMHGHELKVRVLRIKPYLTKFAGIAALAMLVLLATSEGIVSRDLVAALAISLSIAAFAAAMLAYRQGRQMQRSAQDYFARIENAARRLERDSLLLVQEPREPVMTPVRRGSSAAKSAEAANTPRLAQGIRPTVIEGGKAKAERLNAEMSAADDALLVALDTHAVAVSLEPVVELQSSKVAAYRVHAHVTNADGTSVHLRRLEGNHPGIDPARFDMELFHAAAGAARRLFGAATDITPLICPISAATLGSPKDLRKIVAMMNNLPGLKSGLVLEMPAQALVHGDIMLSGAGLLADAAIRLCVEGRLESRRLQEIGQLAVADRDGREANVIARGVAEDHEVVAMIDAGVLLVCGPRFSDPKPLKTLNPDASIDRGRISQW
jgi:cyclic-di-GMP phosphodiesterase, flagellum assembly factor TipF